MLVIPFINKNMHRTKDYLDFVNRLIQLKEYEPGLVALKNVLYTFDISVLKQLKPTALTSDIIKNTLGVSTAVDNIGRLLSDKYEITPYSKWRVFLGYNYKHANEVLFFGNKSFFNDKNSWLNYMDSFNDIIIRAFIVLLQTKFPSEVFPNVVDNKGINIDYGRLIAANGILDKKFPNITRNFREYHKRRSSVPTSHAYDKFSRKETKFLVKNEEKNLTNKLKNGFNNLVIELQKLL
jgi:hypothetical protein